VDFSPERQRVHYIVGDRKTLAPPLRRFLADIEPRTLRSPSIAKHFGCCLVFVSAAAAAAATATAAAATATAATATAAAATVPRIEAAPEPIQERSGFCRPQRQTESSASFRVEPSAPTKLRKKN